MGERRSGLLLSIVVCASVGTGCHHGVALGSVAPTPAPDEMAPQCAKLDAAEVAVASHAHLESMPSADDAERWQAEYELGLAYYCLGLFSETLAVFDPGEPRVATPGRLEGEIDRAIANGSGSSEARIAYPPTLRLLAALHRRFPGWSGAEDAVAASEPASYDAPALADVRAELAYMAGRSAYRKGQFPRALDLFGRVPAQSPLYARAKLLQGAVHVRNYEAKPAVDAFSAALRAAATNVGPDTDRFRDLANTSLARTFYSTGQFDRAADYYRKIPRESRYWLEQLFEAGWTAYMRGDYAAAMGNVAALRAEAGAVPTETLGDAMLLEAGAAFEAGDDKRSADAVGVFNATVPPLFMELRAFLAANPDDGALYGRIARLRRGKGDLPPAVEPVVRQMLTHVGLGRRFDDVDELTREIALLERLPVAWRGSALAETIAADLTARLQAAIKEAGDLSRRRLMRITQELSQQIKRTIRIDFEPPRGAVSELGRRIRKTSALSTDKSDFADARLPPLSGPRGP